MTIIIPVIALVFIAVACSRMSEQLQTLARLCIIIAISTVVFAVFGRQIAQLAIFAVGLFLFGLMCSFIYGVCKAIGSAISEGIDK